MSNYAAASATLSEALSLSPAQPPIAVCLTDAAPAGVPAPTAAAPAGCAFWERAARGPIATTTRDHELCAIGVHTHQLAAPSAGCTAELGRVLEVMADLTYVRDEDVAAIPVLAGPIQCVVYAPLAATPLPPDVVLVFANARQSLVVAEAAQQVDGAVAPALGRPACAIVPQAINTGRAALSLGCCGARAYLDAMSDDVALWALPGANLAAYVERISALGRANTTLATFHALRRQDVEAGKRPSIVESLARLSGG